MSLVLRAALFLTATTLIPCHAQNLIAVGEVEFPQPAGWSVMKKAANTIAFQHKDRSGKQSLMLIASEDLKGGLEDSVRNLALTSFPDAGFKLDRLREGRSVYGQPAVSFQETGRHKTLGRMSLSGVGLEAGDRLQIAWLFTPANSAALDRKEELEAVIRSWKFKSGTGAVWNPSNPRKGSSGVSGFYWGSRVRNQYSAFGGLQLVAKRNYVVLLPTGQAYRGLPPGGRVMDMDFNARLREEPGKCGLYSVQGDTIIFEWPSDFGLVRRESSPIQRVAGQTRFEFDGIKVSPAKPLPDTRVDGRYTSTTYIGGGPASSTSVTNERSLSLTPDGRYQKSGFSAISFSQETGDGRASGAGSSKSASVSGSYKIEGFRLTLQPDSGPPEIFTIVIETPGPSPKALFINNSAFLRAGN